MRELVFREIYLKRKSYITTAAIMFVLTLLFNLILLSMKVGNLRGLSSDPDEYTVMIAYVHILAIYVPVMTYSAMFMKEGGVAVSDIKTGWNRFARTTPLSGTKQAGARFLVLLIETAAAMLLTLINTAIVCGTNDISACLIRIKEEIGFDLSAVQSLSGNFPIIIAIFAVVMVTAALPIPLLYLFKSEAADYLFCFGVFGGIFLALDGVEDDVKAILFEQTEKEVTDAFFSQLADKLSDLADTVFLAAPFVLVGAFVIGFVLTALVLNRKEV